MKGEKVMYCNYSLLMQNLNNIINQLEQSNNESDKKILDTLRKIIDALKSASELNQNEIQAFLDILLFSMSNAIALANIKQ